MILLKHGKKQTDTVTSSSSVLAMSSLTDLLCQQEWRVTVSLHLDRLSHQWCDMRILIDDKQKKTTTTKTDVRESIEKERQQQRAKN